MVPLHIELINTPNDTFLIMQRICDVSDIMESHGSVYAMSEKCVKNKSEDDRI